MDEDYREIATAAAKNSLIIRLGKSSFEAATAEGEIHALTKRIVDLEKQLAEKKDD